MMDAIVARLRRRRLAYRRCFMDAEGRIHPSAEIVLADLKRFCRAAGSTAVVSPVSKAVDPIAMAMAEGRREVWLRLTAHLYLDERTTYNLQEPNDG